MARPHEGQIMHFQLASAVLLTALLVAPLTSDAKKGGQLWTERRNSAPKYATQIPDFAALAEAVMPGVVEHFSRAKGTCLLFKRPRNVGP